MGERQAHESSIFSLAASDNTLYSCSNDGSIRAWDLGSLFPKGNVAIGQDEFWKLRFVNGLLYSGDDQGGVSTTKKLLARNLIFFYSSGCTKTTIWLPRKTHAMALKI